MVRIVPVISVEEGDCVVALIHRRQRAQAASSVPNVVMRSGQAQVLDRPARDLVERKSVGDHEVRTGVGLPEHALVAISQYRERFAEVRCDRGDT
jgi:hypothetical protein